jgi:hypothetical protein
MNYNHWQGEIARSFDKVDHSRMHPNGTVAHSHWSEEQTLHVAVMYSNTRRWKTRTNLFQTFRREFGQMPNVRLYVVEVAYGARPFEVTSSSNPDDLQLRTQDELWHKENALNLMIARFSPDWKYGAWVDGDFSFTRHDVALETIHQLQHHQWVQMYSTYCDLTHDHKPLRIMKSFGYRFATGELTNNDLQRIAGGKQEVVYDPLMGMQGPSNKLGRGVGTTGAAWAFRRDSFDACGGLLDTCVLGSGDWHMAFGLAGRPDVHPQVDEMKKCGLRYVESIKTWQNRAATIVKQNIGAVDCHAIHHFHGSKVLRKYGERWKILRDTDFNPYTDLYKDSQGLYQLTKDKIELRDSIRRYFQERNEDDISLRPTDTILGG